MSEKDRPDPDGTEMIDLGDADVSAVPVSEPGQPIHERSLPPPLPEGAASAGPSVPPPAAYASMAPPAPGRSNRFYVMLLVGFVGVGIVVGIAVALSTRSDKKSVVVTPASASAAGAATATVMTLPTIDMNDDEADGGK